jgi:hypothetical protein
MVVVAVQVADQHTLVPRPLAELVVQLIALAVLAEEIRVLEAVVDGVRRAAVGLMVRVVFLSGITMEARAVTLLH